MSAAQVQLIVNRVADPLPTLEVEFSGAVFHVLVVESVLRAEAYGVLDSVDMAPGRRIRRSAGREKRAGCTIQIPYGARRIRESVGQHGQ